LCSLLLKHRTSEDQCTARQMSDMALHNHSFGQTTAPGGTARLELPVEAFDTAAKATARIAPAANFVIVDYDESRSCLLLSAIACGLQGSSVRTRL
jgi:hypothetical protein